MSIYHTTYMKCLHPYSQKSLIRSCPLFCTLSRQLSSSTSSPQVDTSHSLPQPNTDSPFNPKHSFVYTWGRGDSGQLGHGDEKNESLPSRIPSLLFPSLNAGVSCGLFHSATWHSEGSYCYLWGKGQGGRLGLGHEDAMYLPKKLPEDTLPDAIASLSLGGLHSAAVTVAGEVFTWGFGGFGALGHGGFVREVCPRRVEGELEEERVVQVASGGAHTCAVTESGGIFSWGRDEGEGRLGHSGAEKYGEGACPLPFRVTEIPPVTAVANGGFFTAAISMEGEVWTWGGNMNSELGRGPGKLHLWRPGKATGVSARVVQVACGGYHAAAVDENGGLWTWGRGGHGQLGNETLQTEFAPRPVDFLKNEKIVKVACGGAWTAAISEEGELFVWGKNSEGQLGDSTLPGIVTVPHKLEAFSRNHGSLRVLDIGAGASHGVALVMDNDLQSVNE